MIISIVLCIKLVPLFWVHLIWLGVSCFRCLAPRDAKPAAKNVCCGNQHEQICIGSGAGDPVLGSG